MTSTSDFALENFDSFLTSLVDDELEIFMDIEVGVVTNLPRLQIHYNEQILLDKEFAQGNHCITLKTKEIGNHQLLKIGMINKTILDTIVEDEKIIKDKFVSINELRINNYILTKDYDFFYNCCKYKNTDTDEYEPVKKGFWSNSFLEIYFDKPFVLYYNSVSKLNVELSDSLKFTKSNLDIVDSLHKSLDKLKK